MNGPHLQSGLIASIVFPEFPVTVLVNVILSEAQNLKIVLSPRPQQ